MTRKDYYTISRAINRTKQYIIDNINQEPSILPSNILDFLINRLIEEIQIDNKEFSKDKFKNLLH